MTASVILSREIARRMNGWCRLNIVAGKAISLEFKTADWHDACATCSAPCESWQKHASGIGGTDGIAIAEAGQADGSIVMMWACPGCGVSVTEKTSLLRYTATAKEINGDPRCHRCK